ncbi:ankyrin-like protein [Seal parapoxvirus]|uniref:Ankyrin-like protein n=1 Tax=Seal parapoxvirus TaxID=187984 RepID=A0A1Z3GCX8_9POXV|nr:ankyrin-like protein [Seal parapoxvirus]ASC55621.2 ankyrin-like protein [Seal parapoxvirus]
MVLSSCNSRCRRMEENFAISVDSALYDYFIVNAANASVGDIHFLLAQGADVDFVGHFDKTPLHVYLHSRSPRSDVVLAMLEAGALVDTPERCCGATAAHLYVSKPEVLDIEVLRAMLTWGCRRSAEPLSKQFLSGVLREVVVHREYNEQTEQVADLLLGMGAEINCAVGVDCTPLHACLAGPFSDPRLIQCILSRGASVHAKNAHGMTPLAVLLKSPKASLELVRLLLDAGSDPRARDFRMNTLLHAHAESVRPRASIFRELIRMGCSPVATNSSGNTPLHVMAMHSTCRRSLLLPFLEAGVDVNVPNRLYGVLPLHMAAVCSNVRACCKLVLQGADPSSRSATGRTPLASMLVNHDSASTTAALNTHPPANIVAEALAHAAHAGASDASRLCVAYLVARGAHASLNPRVRCEHANFIAQCEAEVLVLRGAALGSPRVTALDILRWPSVKGVLVSRRALRVARSLSIYKKQLSDKLVKLLHKSRLVSIIKKEVCPCGLPAEIVERVLSNVPVADLCRSCGVSP